MKVSQSYDFDRILNLFETSGLIGKKFSVTEYTYSEKSSKKIFQLKDNDSTTVTFFALKRDDADGYFIPQEQLRSIVRFLHKLEIDYLDEYINSSLLS